MLKEIIKKLNINFEKNVCIIENLKHSKFEIKYFDDDGVAIKLIDGNVLLTTNFKDNFDKLLACILNEYKVIFTPSKELAEKIALKLGKNIKNCNQIIYSKLSVEKNDKISVEKAVNSGKIINFIADNYSLNYSKEEIENLILNKVFFVAKYNGEYCGFIGMHDEGSIGLLEVLPKFRNLGIATSLLDSIVNYYMDNNLTPFCHIKWDNVKSINLHKKLKAKFYSEYVYWIE